MIKLLFDPIRGRMEQYISDDDYWISTESSHRYKKNIEAEP